MKITPLRKEEPMQIHRDLFSHRPKVRTRERAGVMARRRRGKQRDFAKGKKVHGKWARWR
jgi:hypothetical protein